MSKWFYINDSNDSIEFSLRIQKLLEERYYEDIFNLYNSETVFVPIVQVSANEYVDVREQQRVVKSGRKIKVNPVYRKPDSSSAASLCDLGHCDRWVIEARADSYRIKSGQEYKAFKVHTIKGSNPDIECSSLQLLPVFPELIANIGKNSFGRSWEMPQIMFSAYNRVMKHSLGVHIQITPKVLADMGTTFTAIRNSPQKFEFFPNKNTHIARKGNYEYLLIEGKHMNSKAAVSMVIGVHVFNEQ